MRLRRSSRSSRAERKSWRSGGCTPALAKPALQVSRFVSSRLADIVLVCPYLTPQHSSKDDRGQEGKASTSGGIPDTEEPVRLHPAQVPRVPQPPLARRRLARPYRIQGRRVLLSAACRRRDPSPRQHAKAQAQASAPRARQHPQATPRRDLLRDNGPIRKAVPCPARTANRSSQSSPT